MAPLATIAAETPQIETAEASITPNSSSTLSRRESQSEKNQTTATTTTAWRIPGNPACKMSVNNMLVPKITRPVFIKNSDRAAAASQPGTLKIFPISKPETKANTTYSSP